MAARGSRKAAERLTEVVVRGDQRKSLEAIRDRLARLLEMAQPNQAAALAKQLTDVISKLDALPTGEEVSPVDDLAKRRATRRAQASGS